MDLEKIATSAIVSTISQTETLSGFINDGDKEPCWDGNVYIHENAKHSKKNIKRIPTQVKGKAVKRKAVKDIIKYQVQYDDLHAYMMDGGTLFFVVYIEKDTGAVLQIYYADLLPVRIMDMLKQSKNSYSIAFKRFPSDNKKKIEVVLNVYNESQRQASYAGKRLPTIEELSKKGVLESVSFHFTHVGKKISPSTIPQVMEGKALTMYANITGNPIGIPVEKYENITSVITCQTFDKTIYVNKVAYYDQYRIIFSASDAKMIIGKCLTMTTPLFTEGNETLPLTTIKIKVEGTLQEQIKGLEFIQALFNNNGYEIEDTHIPIHIKEKGFDKRIQEFSNRLNWLKNIHTLLTNMHVQKDFEINCLSENEEKNLNYFISAMGERKPVREEGKKIHSLQLLKIANIALGIIYVKHANGYCYMYDYFGNHFEVYYKDGDKITRISQFADMTMDDFLKYDNVCLSIIVEDFKLLPLSEEIVDEANLLMLEMIKAYDQSQNEDLLDAAKQINEWLQEDTGLIEQEICIINACQIKVRRNQLCYRDKATLFTIAEKSEDINCRAGALILLGDIEEVNKIFSSFSKEEMQQFINYPIYALYQHSGEKYKSS